jgi:4-hydroxybenzoate polyprenyltransferase
MGEQKRQSARTEEKNAKKRIAVAEKEMIRSIARELIQGGHLLALGTASIAAFCSFLLGKVPTVQLLLMAYLFSYGAYTLDRSVGLEKDELSNPTRTRYLMARKKILPLIAAGCFAVGYTLAYLANLAFFLVLLVPLALSLAYSVGARKFRGVLGASKLKEKLLVKNFVISFGWSLIPILVGLYFSDLSLILVFVSGFVFIRLLVNTIFFDARDVASDAASGVKTIPVTYGMTTSFRLIALFDIASAAYIVLAVWLRFLPLYALVMVAFTAYSTLYRHSALKNLGNMDFLCDVVGDGEYVLWGAVLLLGRAII